MRTKLKRSRYVLICLHTTPDFLANLEIVQPGGFAMEPHRRFTSMSARQGLPALAFAILVATFPLHAQYPAHFQVSIEPDVVHPGETATLWIDVELESDWHIYSTTTPPGGPYPTEISLTSGPLSQVGGLIQPDPVVEHDPNFDLMVEYYGKSVRFGIRGYAPPDAAPGSAQVAGEITYMLCNESSCLPPATEAFSIRTSIEEGPIRDTFVFTEVAAIPADTDSDEILSGTGSILEVDAALSEGIGAFLYLSLTMGFLALLTPCVFPMVPITVSFFTKQSEGDPHHTRSKSIRKSVVYCGGIITTFTGLGMLLAGTLGASGAAQFAANPWVNLVITAIFVIFALSLFGLFEIQIPTSILNQLNSTQGGGYAGILLMGFTFSLTSFTCTAPFVGTLLVLTTQGTWLWPILGMLAFSVAFALPFFFLSLFPQSLSALPKSGGWLNSVKVVMGFLELAAAMKFLSNVDLVWNWGLLNREVFIASWIAIFLLCGIYLLGKIRLPNDTPLETVGPGRLLATVGFFTFSFFLLTGLFGSPLGELDAFFPPYGNHGTIGQLKAANHESLEWTDDYEAALTLARETDQNVFVDFTGYACTNCRWMEANVFPEAKVHALLENYVLVQLYTDGQGEKYDRNRELQKSKFGTVALPFYAIVTPSGDELARFPGMTRDRERFQKFLSKGTTGKLRANL
jgi:thiol:disulfide interchange protein